MEKYIFPEIKIDKRLTKIIVSTTLRKKHRGNWYFWEFMGIRYISNTNENINELLIDLLIEINRNVYFTLILGKVNPDIIYPITGKEVFRLDETKKDEAERLKEKYKI